MIYFVQMGDIPFIKIGFTDGHIEARLRDLQCGSPVHLRVVSVVDGSPADERSIHAALWQARHLNEWFEEAAARQFLYSIESGLSAGHIARRMIAEDSERQSSRALTLQGAKEILASVVTRLVNDSSTSDLATKVGVNETTIRNARSRRTLLQLSTAANLLLIDGTAFDGFLALVGRRSVPHGAVCDTDTDRARESSVLKAALALSEALADDDEITPAEVRANRATIEAARDALDQLLSKLVRAA